MTMVHARKRTECSYKIVVGTIGELEGSVKSARGTSGGQYSHFLSDIVLSQSAETVFDVDDVRSSAAADARLFAQLEAAPRVELGEVLAGSARGTVRVEYDGSFAAYAALARLKEAQPPLQQTLANAIHGGERA